MKVKLDPHGILPKRAHSEDVGFDLYAPHDFTIWPGETLDIGTGVHVQIPNSFAGFICTKSSMNICRLETTGLIDHGYTGEIKVVIHNYGEYQKSFKRGDKISQLVIVNAITPWLEQVDELPETERGNGGFGSTGR